MSESHQVPNADTTWLNLVKRHVKSLHYGVVQIVVHNDRVVQIERTEKVRLNDRTDSAAFDPSI